MKIQFRGERLSLLLMMICIQLVTQAQQGSITGKISGLSEDQPLVRLFRLPDSALLKTAICETDGRFEFLQVKQGSYFISISHVGYLPYTSQAIEINESRWTQSIAEINLKRAEQQLQVVEVNSRKPFVQRKIDRIVVNPAAIIGNANATSLEMLERSPGIMVDLNGNISLKGKQGVMVFIDDKPTYMSSADLSNYLRSLPASSVESIEIMTNPPARYEAAGNAGIINIKLKKNLAKGINGGINLGYGQGKYSRINNSFSLNYRINKINLFTNLGWNENKSYQDLTINRYYLLAPDRASFLQHSYIKRKQTGQTARAGIDYYASPGITLGVVLAGFINPSASEITNRSVIRDLSNAIASKVNAFNPSNRKWKNGSINLNGTFKLDKKGQEITANADYIKYSSTSSQTLTNEVYDAGDSLLNGSTLYSNLPAAISIQTLSTDYNNPLKDGSRIGAGWKSSFVNTDNTAAFYDITPGGTIPNYEFSNRFQYKENINAVYVNYSKDWKSISVQAGLRLENTNIDGYQFGNPVVKDSAFTRHYTNLFPTFYLAYRADSLQKNQFGLSIGRRINRPSYQDMNPFTYPLDRYTYYAGNPFLQPTFSYNIDLSYTFRNMITTSLEYSYAKDVIQETNEQRNTIYYSRPGNFGRQTTYGIDVNATLKPAKWWILQVYTELKNLGFKSQVYTETLNDNRWYWYIGPTNQFTINPNLTAELAGTYQTRVLVGQFLTIAVWQMRAGLSQKIMKGKGSVRLNVSDIFYTNQPGGDIRNISYSRANWLSYLDSRVYSVGFSYRFNKGKSLNARNSGASEAEKGRVKTN